MGLLIKIVILQTIVFGLVLFFLKKILTGDTESVVNRLNESYEEMKKKKEELSRMTGEIEAEYNKRKEEADKVSNEVIDKAKNEANVKKEEIVKEAKKESEALIAKAMGTVDNIRREVSREMYLKTVEFCAELLKGILTQKGSAQIHEVFVNDFIDELKGLDMSKIGPEVQKLDLTSFKALSEKDKKAIEEIASSKLKRKVAISETVNGALLGGVILKFGGLALDGSFEGRIKEVAVEHKKKIEG